MRSNFRRPSENMTNSNRKTESGKKVTVTRRSWLAIGSQALPSCGAGGKGTQ